MIHSDVTAHAVAVGATTITVGTTAIPIVGITGLAGATIAFDPASLGTLSLLGGGPTPEADVTGNTYNVQVVPATATLVVNAGPDDDTINVGSPTSQLDSIAGNLNIHGQDGFNTITINDQNTFTPQTYTLAQTNLTVTGGASIDYDNLQKLTLNGGAGGNTVDIEGTAMGALTTIGAGAGNVGSVVNTVTIGSGG